MPHCVQTEQKRMVADKEAERQHQERLKEGFLDDPSLAEILEVVDRPLQAAPNPNAPGGAGHPGPITPEVEAEVEVVGPVEVGVEVVEGGGYGAAQFERGDLPPRFRQKTQN